MDRIETRVDTQGALEWRYRSVELLINGEPLIEIVRKVELPHACREFDERVGMGESAEDLGERGSLAGAYLSLPTSLALPPSQNFFGSPYDHGFLVDEDNPANGKSVLLGCSCGIIDCWFLLADITVETDRIVWEGFQQFHRDWSYEIPPFIFDREQYEMAFARQESER